MPNSPADEQRINAIRFLAVDAVQKANSGHPGMPMGAAAMAYTLWTRHLRFNPERSALAQSRPLRPVRRSRLDAALRAAVPHRLRPDARRPQALPSVRQQDAGTPREPSVRRVSRRRPGRSARESATRSAWRSPKRIWAPSTTGTIERSSTTSRTASVGDGDLMEGISQEAVSLAGHLKLGKLIVLYDDNLVSLAGPTDITLTDDPCARFDASGWHTQFVDIDHGNDVATIDQAIAVAKNVTDRPSFIAVRTHIGYGSPRQDNYLAHGEPLGPENVTQIEGRAGLAARARLLRARRRVEVFPRDRRQRRGAGGPVESDLRRVEDRQYRSGRTSSSARCAASFRPICRGRRSTPRTATSRLATPAVR